MRSGLIVAAVVASIHLWVGAHLFVPTSTSTRSDNSPTDAIASAFMIPKAQNDWDTVPAPEIRLRRIAVDNFSLNVVRFEDQEEGDASDIIASDSAPYLTRSQPADRAEFARRAGLEPKKAETVILVVEVLSDGSVGSTRVMRSSGRLKVDKAAVDYARMLHWVPGTKKHRTEAMLINFSVTLVWRAD